MSQLILVGVVASLFFGTGLAFLLLWLAGESNKKAKTTFRFEETVPPDLDMKRFEEVLDDIARRAYERVGGSAGFRCL